MLSLNEIAKMVANKAVDIAEDIIASKAADAIVNDKEKEEDAETIAISTSTPGTTTPGTTVNSSGQAIPLSQNTKDDDDNDDVLIAQFQELIKKHKDKQLQDAQLDYAYRQEQANNIVGEIDELLKKYKK